MDTQRSLQFCTGSEYLGTFNKPMNCMEGYGIYLFPDRSEYHGYFRRGLFHGYGRLTLAPPYSLTFFGEFDNGKLTIVNKMKYSDGLLFNADFKSGKLNTKNWAYLSKSNRQYPRELCMGLPPVVPHEPLTRYNARTLEPNTYDTEEGIYMEQSNFITQIPQPFNPQRYVSCKEVEWIRKHCRRAEHLIPVEPDEESARAIIENNIKTSAELGENLHTCTCNLAKKFHEARLHKCCHGTFSGRDDISALSGISKDYQVEPSSSNTSSFTDNSMELDLHTQCYNEVQQLSLKDNESAKKYFLYN